MKLKKILPWLLIAVAAIVLFGVGNKVLQFFGISKTTAEKISAAEAKANADAVVSIQPDETKLTYPIGWYTDFAAKCYDLTDSWFHLPSTFDYIIKMLHTLNAEDIRQVAKSYVISYSHDKTLFQAITEKFKGGILGTGLFGGDDNMVYQAFNEAFQRGNVNI